MLIHKAWYGPKGGHALLSSSTTELHTVFRQAAWLTDLPGTLPTGLKWQPYFRTCIHDGFFMLVHTKPSNETSRAGMVNSVAAFIPLIELPLFPDFHALANDLEMSHDREDREPFVPNAIVPSRQSNTGNPLLLEIANGLISAKNRPFVHIGQAGFDDVMLDLLQVAPKQLRHEMLFSISFSPEDARSSVVLAVPQELVTRFPKEQKLSSSNVPPSTGIGVAALLGLSEGQPLLDFCEAAAFDLQSAKSITLLEQTFSLWSVSSDVGGLISLVRLLAAKSGNSPSANQVRTAALDRLTSRSSDWNASDVLAMRNLSLDRFHSTQFTEAVKIWVSEHANQSEKSTDDFALLADGLRKAAKQDWWNSYVYVGYVNAVRRNRTSLASLAWQTIENIPQVDESVLKLFFDESQLEGLVLTVPQTLNISVASSMAQACERRDAWQLCGLVLAAAYAPHQALFEILKLAPTAAHRRISVESALSKATFHERVTIALREDKDEVTSFAAEAVVKDNNLLSEFDWSSPVWFDILDRVIAHCGPSVGTKVPNSLLGLETMIDNKERSERLWGPLVRAELADLSQIKNQSVAWALVPQTHVATVLKLSAKQWLKALVLEKVRVENLGKPLLDSVKLELTNNNQISNMARNNPTLFITIINSLFPNNDGECVKVLDSLANKLNYPLARAPAIALGKLIRERDWSASATRVASIARSRDDFLPICGECLKEMKLLDKIYYSFRLNEQSLIPDNELWQLFEETLIKLYPHGPTTNAFWSRSGGEDQELTLVGNGIEQWHRCIKQVRAGRGPTGPKLLATALQDFDGNSVLILLRDSGVRMNR